MEKKGENFREVTFAKDYLDAFAERTGIVEGKGDAANRYLWTDAFAVHCIFALFKLTKDQKYHQIALRLIDLVHFHLGRFHPEDSRIGWISGLSEEEGKNHPTAGGLRIGKKHLERNPNEAFQEQFEWERDGQYFHYISRWIVVLLQAQKETGDEKYLNWAAELLLASEKFISEENGELRMYWKMSTDLSRPLINSMGSHDPLEGLICAATIKENLPKRNDELNAVLQNFKKLCTGKDWITTDPLGIGGLLITSVRASALKNDEDLPSSSKPQKLLENSLYSLKNFRRFNSLNGPANQRLAFRECGLSLGLRVLDGAKENSKNDIAAEFDAYIPLADKVESFWESPENQKSATWTEHLNINSISLASSLFAKFSPESFG
ncbi:hypothetical protein [Salegentibacter sp.]|uniref:hypothetical protein n=1 Tax=Salegentibacter sp. TaxID=1903072 RepID=UPI0035689E48